MIKSSVSAITQSLAAKSALSQQEAERFIRQMFDVAHEGLQREKMVKIKWLGTFKVTAVKDRESVDVNTGERIVIEGRDKINFTPDNILREIVNKPFEQFETVVVNDGVDFDEIDRKFAEELVASDVADSADSSEEVSESAVSDVVSFDEEPQAPATAASAEVIVVGEEKSTTQDISEEPAETEQTEEPAEADLKSEESPDEESEESQEELNESSEESKESQEISERAEESREASDEAHEEEVSACDEDEAYEDEAPRGFVVSKPLAAAACIIVVLMLGGMGWMAYNYQRMSARQFLLEQQLIVLHQKQAKTPRDMAAPPAQDADAATLRQKAKEDSARQMKVSEAVAKAEEAKIKANEVKNEAKAKSQEAKAETKAKNKTESKPQTAAAAKPSATDGQYDKDVRIRTGAYCIVGLATTVEVKKGQTLASISKAYLGPGMECYVEAYNGGISEVKAGQKIKIPKLELKKKRNFSE